MTIVMLALALALYDGTASAHASYVRSSPAADARLARAPAEVRVAFSEAPDVRGSDIEVLDVSGRRVDGRDLRATGSENELAVTLPGIGDGGYLVAWTALSTVDGHTTKGTFAFAVGDAPLPALPDVPDAYPAPGAIEIAGRVLSFGGIAVVLGHALFALVVRPPSMDGRASALLVIAGGAALIAGAALLLVSQGGSAPPRLAALLGARAAAGAVAIVVMARAVPRDLRPRQFILLACGVAAALSATLVSHAAAANDPVAMALDLVHVAAMSAWLGGIATLLAVVFRGAQNDVDLAGTVRSASLLFIGAVTVLVASGTVQSLQHLVLVQDLVETPYGIALSAKIALLIVTAALGALNFLVWTPRLRAGRDTARSRRALVRGSLGESALLALVLVATAALTALVPPGQASGAAFDETQHVDGLRLELLVPGAAPGRNRYVLRVHEGLRPVRGAEKVALRFTMIEHDMGETELVAAERAAGEYVAEGSPTAMFGTWRVEAIVRLSGRDDVRTVFTVPIGAPAGQETTARVLTAGEHTLIVFLDPGRPVAGMPFEINVVVVDQRGDPVGGKQLHIRFEGPEAAAGATADEPSRGRYRLGVAALSTGTWQLTIVLDGATATYGFEVAR